MRLFVALVPPPEVLRGLDAAVRRLADTLADTGDALRWTADADRHLTLAFLGEVDPGTLPALGERLDRAAHRHPPMTLRLAGAGRFGDRVLWAGVAGDTDALRHLAGSVSAAARRCGIAVEEGRAFRAHVTLARGRGRGGVRGPGLRPHVAALAAYESEAWTADRIELIHSLPPMPGVPGARPRYETAGTWALGR
ncbi:RNA 2',3'-cyclic phosphodiesterase [Streptantibioticus parmotrematis]|uniref:RNA 2',3'-cyclic phosphodiesterase n=1 Tax=Streptantibioticus parmotrematis TaxID=2873249 RepID=UPI0033EF6831